ncbi:hypothetical protein [Texas Phoenix palm phytoplasma]|nr:hypothetical protein [Texas Phoenix palm phytoplasma]
MGNYKDKKIGQGREKIKDFLIQNPEILEDLKNKIKNYNNKKHNNLNNLI